MAAAAVFPTILGLILFWDFFGICFRQFSFHGTHFGRQLRIVLQFFGKGRLVVVIYVIVENVIRLVDLLPRRLAFGQVVHKSHPGGRFLQLPLLLVPFLLPPQFLFGDLPGRLGGGIFGIVVDMDVVVVVCLLRGQVLGELPLFLFVELFLESADTSFDEVFIFKGASLARKYAKCWACDSDKK